MQAPSSRPWEGCATVGGAATGAVRGRAESASPRLSAALEVCSATESRAAAAAAIDCGLLCCCCGFGAAAATVAAATPVCAPSAAPPPPSCAVRTQRRRRTNVMAVADALHGPRHVGAYSQPSEPLGASRRHSPAQRLQSGGSSTRSRAVNPRAGEDPSTTNAAGGASSAYSRCVSESDPHARHGAARRWCSKTHTRLSLPRGIETAATSKTRGGQEAGEGGGGSSSSPGGGACSRCDGSHAATASAAPTSGPVGACSAARLSRCSSVSSSPLPPRAASRSGSAEEATGSDSREGAAAWVCSSGGVGSGKCSGACTRETWQHSTPCMKRDTPARRATSRARRTRGWCSLERCRSAARLANSSRPSVPPPSTSYFASTPAASL
mmetsp:Transcript_20721/g.62249  ORF Transcript_20721/g.62249 Transcript_20721/m.62249 type:complete len:382 (+) Transcript_20721:290-1435(+)